MSLACMLSSTGTSQAAEMLTVHFAHVHSFLSFGQVGGFLSAPSTETQLLVAALEGAADSTDPVTSAACVNVSTAASCA